MDYQFDKQRASEKAAYLAQGLAGIGSATAPRYDGPELAPAQTCTQRAHQLIQALHNLSDIQGNSRRLLHGSYPQESNEAKQAVEPALEELLERAYRMAEQAISDARIIMEKL